eukprot:1814700-Pleurochrysis_carterae.AAC.1
MHATSTPRTTRLTCIAYGNGAHPGHLWCLRLHCTRPYAVCVTSPPEHAGPLSAHCIGLTGHAAGERDRWQRLNLI